jgi:hypothetical protein
VPPSAEGTPTPAPAPPLSQAPPASQGPGGGEDGAGGKDKEAHPPAKKYKLTEDMKSTIWALVCLSNECCRIENEKKCVVRSFSRCFFFFFFFFRLCSGAVLIPSNGFSQLEGVVTMVSDQGLRKTLYQKVRAGLSCPCGNPFLTEGSACE